MVRECARPVALDDLAAWPVLLHHYGKHNGDLKRPEVCIEFAYRTTQPWNSLKGDVIPRTRFDKYSGLSKG